MTGASTVFSAHHVTSSPSLHPCRPSSPAERRAQSAHCNGFEGHLHHPSVLVSAFLEKKNTGTKKTKTTRRVGETRATRALEVKKPPRCTYICNKKRTDKSICYMHQQVLRLALRIFAHQKHTWPSGSDAIREALSVVFFDSPSLRTVPASM